MKPARKTVTCGSDSTQNPYTVSDEPVDINNSPGPANLASLESFGYWTKMLSKVAAFVLINVAILVHPGQAPADGKCM